MAKKSKKQSEQFLSLTRVNRTVFFFIGLAALTIIVIDSGNLIPREAVIDRWAALSVLLIINTLVWYFSSKESRNSVGILTALMALSCLVFAGYTTYWERGMASTSTILYVIPLLIIATLKSRHALLAMATLAVGTHSLAAVKYFNDYFNEGYRIQLWSNLLLIGGSIFIVTWLIMILTGLRHDSK